MGSFLNFVVKGKSLIYFISIYDSQTPFKLRTKVIYANQDANFHILQTELFFQCFVFDQYFPFRKY